MAPLSNSEPTSSARGAYGLRLGLPVDDRFLVDVPDDAPEWTLEWRLGTYEEGQPERVSDHEAVVNLQPAGRAHLQREARRSTLYLPAQPKTEAWPHPHLSSTAVIAGRWMGRQSFHAGAFVHEGKAWAVLGEREDGKSSALAWLALHDVVVLADDIVVMEDAHVLAGPRCLDLRHSAHEHFSAGNYIGQVGTRERWRIPLAAAPYKAPFGGFVVLAWDDNIATKTLPATQRLPLLLTHRGVHIPESDNIQWFSMLSQPMVQLRRPKDWSAMDEAMASLLRMLSAIAVSLGAPRAH